MVKSLQIWRVICRNAFEQKQLFLADGHCWRQLLNTNQTTIRNFACGTRLVGFCGISAALIASKTANYVHCTSKASTAEETISSNPWLISHSMSQYRHSDNRLFLIRCIAYLFNSTIWLIKVVIRVTELTLFFSTLMIFYPLACSSKVINEVWWSLAVWLCKRSGPTPIKLGQWACTRRDIFSTEFCDRLSVLHTKTTHRQWKFSQHLLDKLFNGPHWRSVIQSVESDPIGSGCIAQVYKGVVDVKKFEQLTGIRLAFTKAEHLDVAIKVAKEGVRERIELDLSILRIIARTAQTLLPSLSYIDPVTCLNHFESHLELQVDLRNEAKAMRRFARNFAGTNVRFPHVLCFSKDVIIETYENGININELVCDEKGHSSELKKKVALAGVRALLKMIFVDNFVHGDLHPGNILVSMDGRNEYSRVKHDWSKTLKDLLSKMRQLSKSLFDESNDVRLVSGSSFGEQIEPSLIVLDTGLAIEQTPRNLRNLRLLFRDVVDEQSYNVGQLLLRYSPSHDCKNPEQFYSDVDHLVKSARSKSSLRKLNISEMLNELCAIVRRHRVSLDPSFTTVILAVMVLEGLGRSLHPDLDLFECARPYLFSMI